MVGAAFVVLASTLSTIGTIPVASIALILGVHRFIGEAMAVEPGRQQRRHNRDREMGGCAR